MIQIDIEMPKTCAYCPMRNQTVTYFGNIFHYCGAAGFAINNIHTRPEKLCPLIEVKDGDSE